jgi:hypothetical protein
MVDLSIAVRVVRRRDYEALRFGQAIVQNPFHAVRNSDYTCVFQKTLDFYHLFVWNIYVSFDFGATHSNHS